MARGSFTIRGGNDWRKKAESFRYKMSFSLWQQGRIIGILKANINDVMWFWSVLSYYLWATHTLTFTILIFTILLQLHKGQNLFIVITYGKKFYSLSINFFHYRLDSIYGYSAFNFKIDDIKSQLTLFPSKSILNE